MISYEKLVKKPLVFKSINGLSIEEIEQFYQRLAPAWVEHERQCLGAPQSETHDWPGAEVRAEIERPTGHGHLLVALVSEYGSDGLFLRLGIINHRIDRRLNPPIAA